MMYTEEAASLFNMMAFACKKPHIVFDEDLSTYYHGPLGNEKDKPDEQLVSLIWNCEYPVVRIRGYLEKSKDTLRIEVDTLRIEVSLYPQIIFIPRSCLSLSHIYPRPLLLLA